MKRLPIVCFVCGRERPIIRWELDAEGLLGTTDDCPCGMPPAHERRYNRAESAKRAPLLRELAGMMRGDE